ncbi:MAG: hypothetical protein AAI978_00865 [Candidatus Hodgkinia cicadicola]
MSAAIKLGYNTRAILMPLAAALARSNSGHLLKQVVIQNNQVCANELDCK